MHTRTHTYMHIAHAHIHTHMHTHMHTHAHNTHTHTHASTPTTHTHTHTHTLAEALEAWVWDLIIDLGISGAPVCLPISGQTILKALHTRVLMSTHTTTATHLQNWPHFHLALPSQWSSDQPFCSWLTLLSLKTLSQIICEYSRQ